MRTEEPVRKNHLSNYLPMGDGGFILTCGNAVQITREPCKRLTEKLREALPADVPLVCSLVNPFGDAETFIKLAKEQESSGVDLIEVNGGCPSALFEKPGEASPEPETKYGGFVGTSMRQLEEAVRGTVEAVKIPVGVKMTPQAGFPGMMVAVEASVNSGAKYVLTAHMPLAVGTFDIWDGGKPMYPLLKHVEANPVSAYGGGEAIRVINHYHTACASMFFPNVDVWSGGGITTGEHLVESIMLGAKAVQAAGTVMFHGISQIRRMIKFLENYMEQCGYKTIEDFRGLATKYVKPWDEALVEQIRGVAVAAKVDETKCSGCRTCTESLCPAIQMEENLAVVNEDNCAACGLCLTICPEGAINMASSKQTLGERVDQGPDYTYM
jgi:dihydroorotate dehydrogenase/Pyruvate/2-oxoacid:ferredoxin oxidoreductase delta subunit